MSSDVFQARVTFVVALIALISACEASVCFMGQQPDPNDDHNRMCWVLPYPKDDRCGCTEILPGGINTIPLPGSHDFLYTDSPFLFVDNHNVTELHELLGCNGFQDTKEASTNPRIATPEQDITVEDKEEGGVTSQPIQDFAVTASSAEQRITDEGTEVSSTNPRIDTPEQQTTAEGEVEGGVTSQPSQDFSATASFAELPTSDEECSSPLGMENGDIEDGSITASTEQYWSDWKVYWKAEYGRLNHQKTWGNSNSDSEPWIEVDLGTQWKVSGVITQGFQTVPVVGSTYWVGEFKIKASGIYISDTGGQPETFYTHAVKDNATESVTNYFSQPVDTKIIRIEPIQNTCVRNNEQSNYCALRFEILGC